jgi:hypothetical protein
MSKQILSEEFRRMQKLAGLITESEYKQKSIEEIGAEASFLPVDPIPNMNKVYSDLAQKLGDKLTSLPAFNKLTDIIVNNLTPEEKEDFITKFKDKDTKEIFNILVPMEENSLNEEIDRRTLTGRILNLIKKAAGLNLVAAGGAPVALIAAYALGIPGFSAAYAGLHLASLIASFIISNVTRKLLGINPDYDSVV